jgi:uncharacterized membrane protein
MTDQQAQPAQAPAFRMNRVEAFSDGVFAIAITLLVLEIAVPAGSEHDLWAAVVNEWPSYLAYLVSFSTVGAVWVAHTVITECLVRATPVLIRLNLLLLMVVSFLPFPTDTHSRCPKAQDRGLKALRLEGHCQSRCRANTLVRVEGDGRNSPPPGDAY